MAEIQSTVEKASAAAAPVDVFDIFSDIFGPDDDTPPPAKSTSGVRSHSPRGGKVGKSDSKDRGEKKGREGKPRKKSAATPKSATTPKSVSEFDDIFGDHIDESVFIANDGGKSKVCALLTDFLFYFKVDLAAKHRRC